MKTSGVSLILVTCVAAFQAACADSSSDANPPERSAAPDLRAAVWMGVDSERGSLLTLLHQRVAGNEPSELVVMDLDGNLRVRHDLAELGLSFDWPLDRPEWFPKQGQLVVVSLMDSVAWAVDAATGASRKLSSDVRAAKADPERGRLFLAESTRLLVLEAGSWATLATHAFEQEMPRDLVLGSAGSLNFVLAGDEGTGGTLVRIDPRSFAVETQTVSTERYVSVLAYDDQRHRAFLQMWDLYEATLEVRAGKHGTGLRLAADLVYPHLAGYWKGSRWIYVQNDLEALPNAMIEPEMRIFDAETLRPVRVSRPTTNLAELEQDLDGSLLALRDGQRLERWDGLTLQVTKAADFDGTIGPWTSDCHGRRAYFVLYTGNMDNVQARLVQVRLDTFEVLG